MKNLFAVTLLTFCFCFITAFTGCEGVKYSKEEINKISDILGKVGIVLNVISMILCPIIAKYKNRSVVGWFFGGLFLSFLGLIIVICLSEVEYIDVEEIKDELRKEIAQERNRPEKNVGKLTTEEWIKRKRNKF